MIASLRSFASTRPGRVLLLDGPTGTELERRGFETALPLWTATAPRLAPDLLLQIHGDYVDAGADILTACTFRTTHHTLSNAGYDDDPRELTSLAVDIAKNAAKKANRTVLVAGSMAPLEDCYAPERTPDAATLAQEHLAHAQALLAAGVDLILVETMPTAKEALAASRAATTAARGRVPVIVSLLARPGRQLFDGSALSTALAALADSPVELVAVNCCSTDACTQAMQDLRSTGRLFGAYANAHQPDSTFGQAPASLDVAGYGRGVEAWLDFGATFVGGCCGTGPEHIAHLRKVIDERSGT